jgi:hypothetical protein
VWPWPQVGSWELVPNLLTSEILAEDVEPSDWPRSTHPLAQPPRPPPIPSAYPLRRPVLMDLPIDRDGWWEDSPPEVEEERLRRVLHTVPTIQHLSITESLLHKDKLKRLRRLTSRRRITLDVHAVIVSGLWDY